MSNHTGPYPRASEFVTELGIQPKTVAVDGVTIHGYDSFELNESGGRILRDGELVKVRKEWPNPMVGAHVLTLMAIDRKKRGRR